MCIVNTDPFEGPGAAKLPLSGKGRAAPRAPAGSEIREDLYGGDSMVVDCTIRNLSTTGARLQVPTSFTIPDKFEFVEAATGNGTARPPFGSGAS
jgi:hypothetical protein